MTEYKPYDVPNPEPNSTVSFESWVGGRTIRSIGTNAGADVLPFQRWRHFKEAFAPELIQRAIAEGRIPVRDCLDAFGGSGTTALACQFLGVRPTIIEVNPFLADLIEAKVAKYDVSSIASDFASLVCTANGCRLSPKRAWSSAPATFVEPGVGGRWIFDEDVARRIVAYTKSLPAIANATNRRLLKVLLGGVLLQVSNVAVSGKGRRYRADWRSQRKAACDLDDLYCSAVENAAGDIARYSNRAESSYKIYRGDARKLLKSISPIDAAVFSPPYPNSFDYTDVYNIELWALGYLSGSAANLRLRRATVASHVQIKRTFAPPPQNSALLKSTLHALSSKRDDLWNRNIPDMVGSYFSEMKTVIADIRQKLRRRGQIWMVVGDSRYAGVSIPVADILTELADSMRFRTVAKEPFRSMRTSAQQGGSLSLNETLLVFTRS